MDNNNSDKGRLNCVVLTHNEWDIWKMGVDDGKKEIQEKRASAASAPGQGPKQLGRKTVVISK